MSTTFRVKEKGDRGRTAIVLFDGECNLCNGAVQFILRRDPKGRLRFAALQSEVGRRLLEACEAKGAGSLGRAAEGAGGCGKDPIPASGNPQLSTQQPIYDSLVLIERGRTYRYSDAALRIASKLRFPWPLFGVLLRLPRICRDPLYRFVARHRYRWFGRRAACMVPSPAVRSRFLMTEDELAE